MGKMKSYPSFDAYLAAQSPKHRTIIRRLRAFVARAQPALQEAVMWGNGCWRNEEGPVAYVYADTAFVQFGFIQGSKLKDPRRLLQGQGAFVRHVKVRAPADIDPQAFGALLAQAVRLPGVRRGKQPAARKGGRARAGRR